MDFGFDFFLMEAQAFRLANIFPKKHFSDGQLSNELFSDDHINATFVVMGIFPRKPCFYTTKPLV